MFLAAKAIELWHNAFFYEYKKQIPKEYVEKSYALLLRFPRERKVLEEFFELLKDSTEACNLTRYIRNKGVVDGLLLNNMSEYLLPRKPVRIKKVGANELCPCGSGKKFKKCCRGKGIYD